MKRLIILLASVVLLASCTQQATEQPTERTTDPLQKNEQIVIDVSETQPFSEPIPTEEEVTFFFRLSRVTKQ